MSLQHITDTTPCWYVSISSKYRCRQTASLHFAASPFTISINNTEVLHIDLLVDFASFHLHQLLWPTRSTSSSTSTRWCICYITSASGVGILAAYAYGHFLRSPFRQSTFRHQIFAALWWLQLKKYQNLLSFIFSLFRKFTMSHCTNTSLALSPNLCCIRLLLSVSSDFGGQQATINITFNTIMPRKNP